MKRTEKVRSEAPPRYSLESEYLKELTRLPDAPRMLLLWAADEMNESFGLDPQIDTSDDTPVEELIIGVRKASKLYSPYDDDELSTFTKDVINFTLKFKA